MEYDSFFSFLDRHHIRSQFDEYVEENREKLLHRSMKAIVGRVLDNLASSKMNRMIVGANGDKVLWYVLLPDSILSRLWDIVCVLGCCYIAFTVPLFPAFATDRGTDISAMTVPYSQRLLNDSVSGLSLLVCDILVFIITVLDIFLRLHVLSITHNGKILKRPSEFASIYRENAFVSDCFASVPVSLIIWGVMLHNPGLDIDPRIVAYTRIFLIFRLYYFLVYVTSARATFENLISMVK